MEIEVKKLDEGRDIILDDSYFYEKLECSHVFLNDDNICVHCGIEVSKSEKVSDKNIWKDLMNIDLREDVRIKANEIYQKLAQSTRRGKRRKHLVFYCVICAFDELGIIYDPKYIAKIVGIKNSEMTKAYSTCSEPQTGHRSKQILTKAQDLIPRYCEQIGLSSDTYPDVLYLAEEILTKSPELQEKFPQNVAAGILCYYLVIHGFQFDRKDFSNIIQLSEVTIQNMYKQIAQIHNRD